MPSKLEILRQLALKEKGVYGAQRVERAADEIKNLTKLYSPKALEAAFLGDNAKALMTMNPKDFERYAAPLTSRTPTDIGKLDPRLVKSHPSLLATDDYIKYLQTVKGGFNDVPFLEINKEEQGLPLIPFISGHEGRHRNRAMADAGEQSGLVRLEPRAELREPFPRRSQEEYIEALRQELGMTGNKVIPQGGYEGIDLPPIYKQGGEVSQDAMRMAVMNKKVQKKAVGGAPLNVIAKAFGSAALSKKEIASLRARGMGVPGVDFADPFLPPTMRMSEALGNVGAEGKYLNFTEADRSRVFGPNRGGVGFSTLQHTSEPHKKAGSVWGYGNEITAQKKINQNDPDKVIWTTYAGSPEQHKSNTVVVKDAVKTLQEANSKGAINPEQVKLINERISQSTNQNGNLLFPKGFDITDPKAIDFATTFERRTAISDALLGVGVKGPMVRKEFKEANPGVKWTDASNISGILTRETDPALVNANTFDVGPNLFAMENKIIHRPDLNEAFPFQVTGQDLGMRYEPTPFRSAAPDFMTKKGYGPNDPINAWAMSRGVPQQFVSDKYLTDLQKEGYKDGGAVHMAGGSLVDDLISDAKKNAPPVARRYISPVTGENAPRLAPREGSDKPYEGRSTLFPEGIMRDVAEASYREIGPSIVPAERGWEPSITIGRQPSHVAAPVDVGTALTEAGSATDYLSQLSGDAALKATGSPLLATAAAYGPGMIGPEKYVKGAKALGNEAAFRIHQAMTTGEGPLAGALASVAPRRIFIGEKSALYDHSGELAAKAMAAAGKTPDDIWAQTRTIQGADGKWRQEISDKNSKFFDAAAIKKKADAAKEFELAIKQKIADSNAYPDLFPKQLTQAQKELRGQAKASKASRTSEFGLEADPELQGNSLDIALEHPTLYDAYPELRKVIVNQGGYGGDALGQLTTAGGSSAMDIFDAGLKKDPRSTALHEAQHAIQGIEGWSPGGSSRMAFQNQEAFDILKDMRAKAKIPLPFDVYAKDGGWDNPLSAKRDYDKYVKGLKTISPEIDRILQGEAAKMYYKRLAGETEARAVQDRMDFTDAQLAERPPSTDYEFQIDDQIVKPPFKMASGGEVTSDDLILEERPL